MRVVIEADGGSRGNPGQAAYGAVLMNADTGEVIAERGEKIGIATNNVAEYRGLIAGLELFHEHTPDADLAVRMDSKLVVEQMSGNWKIKHPDMKPLALQANRLVPFGTTFTWIPRELNKHADRLANEALDGIRDATGLIDAPAAAPVPQKGSLRGWAGNSGEPTTLILLRHGVTAMTAEKRFSGGLAGRNPGLTSEGLDQIRTAADWLAPMAQEIEVVVTSPVRRTRESAELVAEVLEKDLVVEDGFAEMEFGAWDGLTFAEVREQHPTDLDAWLGSLDHVPGGTGESFREVAERVLAGRDRTVEKYAGRTVLVVSHVTPIKTLVADALGAPLDAVYKMELAPASLTVVSYFNGGPDGNTPTANLRLFNARYAHESDAALLQRHVH